MHVAQSTSEVGIGSGTASLPRSASKGSHCRLLFLFFLFVLDHFIVGGALDIAIVFIERVQIVELRFLHNAVFVLIRLNL